MRTDIGQRIKSIRKQKGITQKELASKLGMSITGLQNYEYGDTIPSLKQIEKIAAALEVPPADIMVDYLDRSLESERISRETNALNVISEMYGVDVQELLNSYAPLNERGRTKALEYVGDLCEQEKYRK